MKRLLPLAVVVVTLAVYAGAIAFGVHLGPRGWKLDATRWLGDGFADGPRARSWHIGSMDGLTPEERASVELGSRLFNETPVYNAAYVKSRISCSNCHLGGGTAPYASPMVGMTQAFPMYSKRAGHKITLQDRIEECMTRSENGDPLPLNSPQMKAYVAYIGWLSEPHPGEAKFVGRGLKMLPKLQPDATHGAAVYAAQCAGCHGEHGEGARRPFPPLWGPQAFNDGAGMNGIEKLAAFVHSNMPQNRKGVLSAQDATDVAAFIHEQPRPAFNAAYEHY